MSASLDKETIMNSPLRVMTGRSRLYAAMGAFALVWLLGPQATPCDAKIMPRPKRFTFKIDPQTPVKDLLPVAPDAIVPLSPWLIQDLTQVPLVLFQKPETIKRGSCRAKNQRRKRGSDSTSADGAGEGC